MQAKTMIGSHYKPMEMVKIRGLTIASVAKDVGEWELSQSADENVQRLENMLAAS